MAIAREELAAVARMIEAEAAVWPEEVERLALLAERVRSQARQLSAGG